MDRQTGKLIARIAENLPSMEGPVMQEWIEDPMRLQGFLSGLQGSTPDPFFKTRKGLYVSEGFLRLVVTPTTPRRLQHFDLEIGMNDAEIEQRLGENHLFESEELKFHLERLISAQPNGEKGELLNDGFANIFYTSSCVVRVHWLRDRRRWFVNTWQRVGLEWLAGSRAFSPATAA
ncbi:hypothetical protein HZA26_04050 [Candidatus Nomurabacteria bacterium]|nr:hypothetical protein [Candidatus Nomurabacteria bacterium]